jgi:predicted phage terminase large subunit-like protein
MRQGVIDNYNETIKPRNRGPNVPSVFIGQRLHQDDLAQFLIDGKDGYSWKKVVLPAIDAAGNVLHPTVNPREMLEREAETNKYVFAAQYQQNPVPSGGGLYTINDFPLLEEEPEILATFITADTAETTDKFNDFTVFSFWGIYKLKNAYVELDEYGLHWLDCYQFKCEPRDLEGEFMQWYADCMRHRVKPQLAAIEKKSTGVTLLSTLHKMQGIKVLDVQRTSQSGSKSTRFLQMQGYVGKKLISLPEHGKHTKIVLDHMVNITANDSHRHDDIADTAYDAIRIAFIDKLISIIHNQANTEADKVVDQFARHFNNIRNVRSAALCRE